MQGSAPDSRQQRFHITSRCAETPEPCCEAAPPKEEFPPKVCRGNCVLESHFWLGASLKPHTRNYLWNEGGRKHRDSAQELEPWEGHSVIYVSCFAACVFGQH